MTIHRFACVLACVVMLPARAIAQTVAQADSAARAATRTNGLPLIATRTLKFTTDEGTWISLDVSPNGLTIVFELLGDLYTMPIGGGQATRITSGQGYDTQPRYSPDGSKLVFISDRNGSENVWIANADGSQPKIMSRSERLNFVSPAWTPDGQYVVVTRAGQLWLYHRDGGSGVQMTGVRPAGAPAAAPPLPNLLGAAFGNDPRYVWVTASGNLGGDFQGGLTAYPAEPEPAIDHNAPRSSARRIGNYQIAQFDRTLGRAAVRTSESEGAFRPMPSRDGRWLVYTTRYDAKQGLKLLDLESGREQWLVMGVQRDASQGGADRDVYPNSAFTPDSRALITSFNGKIWRVEVPSGAVTPIPFTAEIEQQVAPLARFDYPVNDTTLVVSQIRGAQPSPDGRRLVFSALDRLWVADLPAGRGGPGRAPNAAAAHPTVTNARRLTSVDVVEHAPVWSPDGRHVAYVTWDDSSGGGIWRVPVDGGAPQRLTSRPAFYDKISYSPDGRRIVGVRGSLNNRMRTLEDFGSHGATAELEIIVVPATGGTVERVAWLGSGATQQGRNVPHFGPDSTRIYVWTGNSEGLVSMRLDGTDRRSIVRVTGLAAPPGAAGPGAPVTPDEVLISPDGARAVVRSNGNVFVITIPPIGGVAPTVSVAGGSSVPTSRLSKVGGDFVGWSAGGRTAFYSIGRSFIRWDVTLADSLVRDSVARAEQAAAAATAAPAPRPDSTARRDSTALRPDSAGARRGAAYEPFRVDVEITARKDRPEGAVALRGARIITMKGDEILSSGDILIRNNRIVAIGRRVAIPAGTRVIDVSGKTIMPGLVDVHAHTWVAWGVHRPQVSQFLAQLAYGVTTQRDPQTSSEDIVTYADLVETGSIMGPRVYSTGPGIFGADNIRSLDDAREIVRRYADHFNTRTIKQYLAGDRKVRQWVITAAREMGLTTTTEGGSDFVMNLTLMQDGYAGLEHSLPISPLYRDVAQLHAFSGLTYTPTFIVAYGGPQGFGRYLTSVDLDGDPKLRRFTPHDEIDKWKTVQWQRDDQYVHKLHAQQLPKLLAAGGRLGLGSHGELQGLGTHWELWMMASGGMKPHDALRLATITGAESIGLSKDLGSLEAGKLADLIVLDRNPLVDLANTTSLRYVMKNGRLYAAATLDEVWPRQRRLPSQWWWALEPPVGSR